MPMFKALKACPDAVVISPDMAKYRTVGREIRALMQETTPLVEAISIDEAFLDLSGTEGVHGGWPGCTLARLARRIEREIGVTVSIGLSHNKFLAKIASDLDKPRGFAVIGRADALAFLEGKPTGLIWGVGAALSQRLAGDGITRIGQLRALGERELTQRYGAIGRRLARFSRGEDDRPVVADAPVKSVSAETTFVRDLASYEEIAGALRPLCDRVADRLRQSGLAAGGVCLKLKTARFQVRTRSHALADPTQLAPVLCRTALAMLAREIDGTQFRLVGIGAERLAEARLADPPDLFDDRPVREARIEETIAAIRTRMGPAAIARGPGLRDAEEDK
jgi:DNA polymerase-4